MRGLLGVAVLALALPAAAAPSAAVVVIDPGHDLRANPADRADRAGLGTLKIKDGGGTHGVVTGLPRPS